MDTIYITELADRGENVIQAAIDSLENGGTVIIPKGEWHTKPIRLKSNIHIQLDSDATVIFSNDPSDFLPPVFTRWEGSECYNYSPLIYANGCENISITGSGTLIGSGEKWWHWKKLQQKAAEELCYAELNGIPTEKRIFAMEAHALRPSFIQPINCKNVLLEGFTIKDGPQWTIHPVYCSDVVVRNVNVITKGPNTDGLNPDSCENVLIEGCTFDTGDDCIAINSGINEDGMRVGKPCRHIEIRNCTMLGGHGAITIGSAVSGGVEDVYVHDCTVSGTMQGIRLKSMRGRGGFIHNIKFERIKIDNVTDQAIQINMFYESSTVQPKGNDPTDLDSVEISDISGSGAPTAIQIKGLPEHRLKNITLRSISLTAHDAFECSSVNGINIDNVNIEEI